jgi:indole-3-glycerol phosphate synthase
MSRIHDLLQRKRADVAAHKATREPVVPPDDRRVTWDRNTFRIIAEIKRASVSAGAIRTIQDPVELALGYEQAGTAAISVLTENHYFHGSIQDLTDIRKAVRVPLLQKDFILDAYQILEAKEAGADFVLLIARFLSASQISEFLDICETIRMNAIVEVTDENDLAKVEKPVRFLGVNARDLETFEIDLTRFERLRPLLPSTFLLAESGIHNTTALQRVMDLGYNGALIGEHFLRADNPARELKNFVALASRRQVKICGITSEQDAMDAMAAGASALGFVFAPESPRRITPDQLNQFRTTLTIPCIGVFRGNTAKQIQQITQHCHLNFAQIYDVECELQVPIWPARMLNRLEEIQRLQPQDRELIDIKLPDSEMESAWNALRDKNTFALAGGLHPANVGRAVEICNPRWVDVARGVEIEPGHKSREKMRQFIEAVNK